MARKKAANARDKRSADSADHRRYRAPALEKGLDILELLASESAPMPVSEIVQRLGRSTGELFRMVQVLEYRKFIELVPGDGGYRLTGKLVALGLDQPHVKTVTEIALPVMRRLSRTIGQSCHLAVHFNGMITVVARVESHEQLSFTVRVGYSRSLPQTVSGAILYAFQPDDVRAHWERLFRPPLERAELAAFQRRANAIRSRGFETAPSSFVDGIVDLSAPILRKEVAVAALTVPFVQSKLPAMSREDAIGGIRHAAAEISKELEHVQVD
jgi:DNA-binding IclR family transcriptional regulator